MRVVGAAGLSAIALMLAGCTAGGPLGAGQSSGAQLGGSDLVLSAAPAPASASPLAVTPLPLPA